VIIVSALFALGLPQDRQDVLVMREMLRRKHGGG